MKKIILLLTIFTTFIAFSQTQTRDVVYLKNGSIIKGQIKEMNPSENLKIETSDGSLFVYKMSEVLKMEKETYSPSINKQDFQNTTNNFETLSEQKAKDVITTLFTNYNISETVKIIGIAEWDSELRKESSTKRYITGKVKINVFAFGKWKTQFPYTIFGFTRIDGEWYLDDVNSNFSGYGYTSYGRWVRNLYKKVSDVKTKSQIQQAINQKEKELSKVGDYNKPDIEKLTLTPIYLKADNVPLFDTASTKILVKKNCKRCRNDNISSIDKTIKEAFKNSNRYIVIDETAHSNLSNTASFTVIVNRISNKHKGFDSKGKDKGFTCNINYSVLLKVDYSSPENLNMDETYTFTASSNAWNYYPNKQSAFNNALKSIYKQIQKTVSNSEPVALEIKSFELDKKGNPEYIVLEKNTYIYDKRKMNFVIIEKSSLSIKGNNFNLGAKIGEVIYKKSYNSNPDEIRCKILKNNVKKKLKGYIGKESELIGISK